MAKFHVRRHCSIHKNRSSMSDVLCRLLRFPAWRKFHLSCFTFWATTLSIGTPPDCCGKCQKFQSSLTPTSPSEFSGLVSQGRRLPGAELQPVSSGALLLLQRCRYLQDLLVGKAFSYAHHSRSLIVDDALTPWGCLSLINFSFSSDCGGFVAIVRMYQRGGVHL